jgi:hypothetical protein
MNEDCYDKILKRRRNLVSEKNFFIPKYNEYEILKNNNYRVSFLKDICRHYKQKVSGDKKELEDRIYNYLRNSFYIIKVQKNIRGYFQRKYNNLLGPGFLNRNICKNDTDFFTLETMNEISYNQFISYIDSENNVWGFNILSLYNLFLKSDNGVLNPYTRDKISITILTNINNIVKLSKVIKVECNTKLNDISVEFTSKKKIEMRTLELFQKIDELGNYTNMKWFLELNKQEIVRFIRELADIWFYRAQITDIVRRNICYPTGILFRNINLNYISNLSYTQIQKTAINLMEQLINNGISRDYKVMGSYYILSALTLVNSEAAESLPWLYQSVAY